MDNQLQELTKNYYINDKKQFKISVDDDFLKKLCHCVRIRG